jgi:hypothetical protein
MHARHLMDPGPSTMLGWEPRGQPLNYNNLILGDDYGLFILIQIIRTAKQNEGYIV